MSDPHIISLTVQGILLTLLLSLPAIVLATIAGLVVSLVQALTQVQEQTIGFAVKMIVVTAALLVTAHFTTAELLDYTDYIFSNIPSLAKR